ncbi:hypothetical protein BDZ89DRAFT_1076571 [Hymenopellis radicata]|nr:hypothetical protein BDZ89DRAFT_1076571 [Hymenopellis radicata]
MESSDRERDGHIQALMENSSVIIVPKHVLLNKIQFLSSVAENRNSQEAPLYPLYSTILLTHSYTVTDSSEQWELTSQSQAVLYPKRPRATRRTPDESAVFYVWDPAPKAARLRTARPYLGVIKEIKPCILTGPDASYFTEAADVAAALKFQKSLPQVSEQAFYAFHSYEKQNFAIIFVFVGIHFSLLRYERPTDLYPLPKRADPQELAPPAVTIFTPRRKKGKGKGKGKASMSSESSVSNDDTELPDDHVIKYPAKHPDILYYNERALVEDETGGRFPSPIFCAALRRATDMTAPPDAKLHYQASIFDPDPTVIHVSSDAKLAEGKAVIDRAYEKNAEDFANNWEALKAHVETPRAKKPESSYRPPKRPRSVSLSLSEDEGFLD